MNQVIGRIVCGKGEGYRGTSGNRDCHFAFNRVLEISAKEALIISSGSLFKNGTTRTLKACGHDATFNEPCKRNREAQSGSGEQRFPPRESCKNRALLCMYMVCLPGFVCEHLCSWYSILATPLFTAGSKL